MENWSHVIAPSCINFVLQLLNSVLTHWHISICISSSKVYFSISCWWSSHFLLVMRLFLYYSYYLSTRASRERKIKTMFSEHHLEADRLKDIFLPASSFLWASQAPQEWNGVWQRVHSGDQGCIQLQWRLPSSGSGAGPQHECLETQPSYNHEWPSKGLKRRAAGMGTECGNNMSHAMKKIPKECELNEKNMFFHRAGTLDQTKWTFPTSQFKSLFELLQNIWQTPHPLERMGVHETNASSVDDLSFPASLIFQKILENWYRSLESNRFKQYKWGDSHINFTDFFERTYGLRVIESSASCDFQHYIDRLPFLLQKQIIEDERLLEAVSNGCPFWVSFPVIFTGMLYKISITYG